MNIHNKENQDISVRRHNIGMFDPEVEQEISFLP